MIPTRIGQQLLGGTFVSFNRIANTIYSIIVAPKETEAVLPLKTTASKTHGTQSVNDGNANSQAMNDETHTAVQYVLSLTTNGYSDWYLPSHNELELCYRYLKPSTKSTYISVDPPGIDSVWQQNGKNTTAIPSVVPYLHSSPSQTIVTHYLENSQESFSCVYYMSSTSVPGFNHESIGRSFRIGIVDYRSKTDKCNVRAVRSDVAVQLTVR